MHATHIKPISCCNVLAVEKKLLVARLQKDHDFGWQVFPNLHCFNSDSKLLKVLKAGLAVQVWPPCVI